jgi:hypothetical protein
MWLLRLGEALAATEQFEPARQAFEESAALLEAADVAPHRIEADARIAELALAGGDLAEAQKRIAGVLAAPESELGAASSSLRVRFIAWRVLDRVGDPRARDWLDDTHRRLQAQAGRLSDAAARERFLTAFAWHRDIVAAHAGSLRIEGNASPSCPDSPTVTSQEP